jgi:hypothetical protein
MDNLAAETISQGGPGALAPGTSQPPFALLLGLRAIADAEGLSRPDWERAAAAYWNAGIARDPGGNRTAILALFLQRAEGTPWRSLGERAARDRAAGFSGTWFDPARSGEGLVVFQYAADAGFVSWFTYDAVDPTRQVWLYGAGRFADGVLTVEPMLRTTGTRFGAAFDPQAVRTLPWGRVVFRLDGCREARLEYASTDPAYGSGTRALRKLTGVAGSGCP